MGRTNDAFHFLVIPLAFCAPRTKPGEEMALVTDDGARFLIGPQDDLVLIRSRN